MQYLTNIDPLAVIAWRLIMMLLLGLALPQLTGLVISRITAAWTVVSRILGTLLPGASFAAVVLLTLQAEAASAEAKGIRQMCVTPAAAALILIVPAHCFIAAVLQNVLRSRPAADARG